MTEYFQIDTFIKRVLMVSILGFYTIANAQEFNATGGVISNIGGISTYNIVVSGMVNDTLRPSFGLQWVKLNIAHQKLSELAIYLKSPNGWMVPISIYGGGNSTNFVNTVFSNSTIKLISNGTGIFSDTFKSEGSLAVFNTKNVMPNGTWQLMIYDAVSNINSGNLIDVSIFFSSTPAQPHQFTTTKLPILSLHTNGKIIPTDPKIRINYFAIDNPSGVNQMSDTLQYTKGNMLIEIRGSSSSGSSSPKKGYLIRTIKDDGSDSNGVFFGLPKECDFVLNNFWGDVTYTKDVMSFAMYRKQGRYSSRTRYVELFINNQYHGIYGVFEKIKRDKNRVDIAKLKYTDTSGLDVTGGYIFKNDWNDPGDMNFVTPLSSKNYIYHQPDSPHAKQKAYITKFMNTLDTSLLIKKNYDDTVTGYRAYLDYKSFIDYILLQELSVSGDSYIGSTYFYKDKDTLNQKLNMGPAWDFNYSWNRSFGYNKNIRIPTISPWKEMLKDTFFLKEMWCRWNELRADVYSFKNIANYLDSIPASMNEVIYRDYERWPLSSSSPAQFYGNIGNGYHYKTEAIYIKKYLLNRLPDLDSIFLNLCLKANVKNICTPQFSVSFDKSQYCYGDSVTATIVGTIKNYTVTINNNLILNSPTIVKYKMNDNLPIQIITNIGKNFNQSFYYPQVIEKPIFTKTFGDEICKGDTVLLKLNKPYDYSFYPIDKLTKNIFSDSIYITSTVDFNAHIIASNLAGCKDTLPVNFKVVEKPTVLAIGKTQYCKGQTEIIKLSGANTYHWINKSAFSEMIDDSTLKVYNRSNYSYRFYGLNNGCMSAAINIPIQVLPTPILSVLPENKTIVKGDKIELLASGAQTYLWTPSLGLNADTGNKVLASPNITTTYYLKGKGVNGCIDSISFKVNINDASTINIIYPSIIVLKYRSENLLSIETKEPIDAISIINADGKIINNISMKDQPELLLNTSVLSTGVYLIQYQFQDRNYIERFVVR